jgi:RimJ/RimL family protein N-acetyltransferase
LERILVRDFKIKRIELEITVGNKASEQVAMKSGYNKEATMKKANKIRGRYHDMFLFAKVR